MTLKLVMDQLWKGGAFTNPVPLGQATGTSTTCPSGTGRLVQVVLVPVGQAQPVPVGQAYWNRLCLSHWHKQAGCNKPVPLGLGQVKRDQVQQLPCHGSYCELILSPARTSCRLSFPPALLPLRRAGRPPAGPLTDLFAKKSVQIHASS